MNMLNILTNIPLYIQLGVHIYTGSMYMYMCSSLLCVCIECIMYYIIYVQIVKVVQCIVYCVQNAPYDPNLKCTVCGKMFRCNEVQKCKRHNDKCQEKERQRTLRTAPQ